MKPCPFCTSNDIEVIHPGDWPGYVAKCRGCGAIGPYGSSNKEMAIKEWNLRDTPNGERTIENMENRND